MKLLIFSVLFLGYYGIEGSFIDFDEICKTFLKQYETTELEFWDMYRENPYFNNNPKEKKNKIIVSVSDEIHYKKPIVKSKKIIQTLTQTFENKDPKKSKKEVFSKTFKHQERFTWTVLKGINVSHPPQDEETNMVGFLSSMLFKESKNNSVSQLQEKILKKDAKIKVPPKSQVIAKWNIIEKMVDIPWEIKITIGGKLFLKYNDKVETIPIEKLAGIGGLQKRKTFKKGLKIRASGLLTTVSAYSDKLLLTTKPLGDVKERDVAEGEVNEEKATDDDVSEVEKDGAVPVIRGLINIVGDDVKPDSKLGPWLVIAGTLVEYFAGETQSPEQWKAFGKAIKTVAKNIFKSETTKKVWKGIKKRFSKFRKGDDKDL